MVGYQDEKGVGGTLSPMTGKLEQKSNEAVSNFLALLMADGSL